MPPTSESVISCVAAASLSRIQFNDQTGSELNKECGRLAVSLENPVCAEHFRIPPGQGARVACGQSNMLHHNFHVAIVIGAQPPGKPDSEVNHCCCERLGRLV